MSPKAQTWIGLGLIALLFWIRYAWALEITFVGDDFVFLDWVKGRALWQSFSFADALGNAYRPVARNLYFGLGWNAFGASPVAFHLVNLVVATLSLVLAYFVFRALLDAAASAVPTPAAQKRKKRSQPASISPSFETPALLGVLLFSLHPSAATPLAWASGIQDLLAIAFGLGAAWFYLRGPRLLYVVYWTLGLLCKETVILLPAVLLFFDVAVVRVSPPRALLRQLPIAAVAVAWAFWNPYLPWNAASRGTGAADLEPLWIGLRSLFLFQEWEAFIWPHGAVVTVAGFGLLLVAVAWVATRPAPPARVSRPLQATGALWAVSGLVPLVAAKGACVYYAYYPALGLSLALAVFLTPFLAARSLLLRAVGVGGIAFLCGALFVADGFRYDKSLCDGHNMRRSSRIVSSFREDLLAMHPTLEPGSRSYFWSLPYHVGFQVADGPALRLWYDDPMLEGHFWSQWRPDSTRTDYLFAYDDEEGLFEIVAGRPDPYFEPGSRVYAEAHNDLGTRFAEEGRMVAARIEWEKSLEAFPDQPDANANYGVALVGESRFAEAIPHLRRAIQLQPGESSSYYFLGLAHLALDQNEEALDAFERFLRLDDTSTLAADALRFREQLRRDLGVARD